MRVLITGGAGFIGSHLCDSFFAQGSQVSVLDNLSTGSIKNLMDIEDKIDIHFGDIRDKGLVESLVNNCDLVLHMAAAVGVFNILKNPIESISTNFQGSENVLKASVKYNKRIILASTSEVYGKNLKDKLSESDDRLVGPPQKLRWTYSDAKALEEAVAHSYFISNNLQVTTVRLFNTVGPRQSGAYGMVIPRFIEAATQNLPLEIFGDGTQRRVFCHVKDAVNAIMKISAADQTIGEVINVGGIDEISIADLAKKIINELKSKSKIVYTPYNIGYEYGFEDVNRRLPDLTKIKKLIDWQPEQKLNQIIQDSIEYITKEI